MYIIHPSAEMDWTELMRQDERFQTTGKKQLTNARCVVLPKFWERRDLKPHNNDSNDRKYQHDQPEVKHATPEEHRDPKRRLADRRDEQSSS